MSTATRKRTAPPWFNHINKLVIYYRADFERIEDDGGWEEVYGAAKDRNQHTGDQLAWEKERGIKDPPEELRVDEFYDANQALLFLGQDYHIWLARREEEATEGTTGEVYASGQRERANGVAEYLTSQGLVAEARKLDTGRSQGRRYVVEVTS